MTDPAPNMHDGHEAMCLCCKWLKTRTNAGYVLADCRAMPAHFYGESREFWHHRFLCARHCPDFEARDD